MFVAEALEAALLNSDLRMTLGTQKRDLVFIDDVTRGLISAAGAPGIEGQVINLGSGVAQMLSYVAERIWLLTGATSRIILGGRSGAADSIADTWADISLARKLLGWNPGFDLDQGLSETITWMRQKLARQEPLCQAS
jgi:nucleoside-diphosphate-sugar epimerase